MKNVFFMIWNAEGLKIESFHQKFMGDSEAVNGSTIIQPSALG